MIRTRRVRLAAAVVVLVVATGLIVASRTGIGSASPTAHAVIGLPRLGPATAIATQDPALDDIGDPYVAPVGAGIGGLTQPGYAMAWTTDWTANVPMAFSSDLLHWRRVADALPVLPRWATVVAPPHGWRAPAGVSTGTWGPTFRQVGGHWVMWFATVDAETHLECIGAATAADPLGPYTSTSARPLVCQAALGGDIDPSVAPLPDGSLTLVWKNDGNANGTPVGIWDAPLAADGLSLAGPSVRLLGADRSWEHGIVEGPALLPDRRGGWWLFFTGGSWLSSSYDTGVAHCARLSGPCTSAATPLLDSTPTAVSPGGLDTFADHQGRLWASYSAFPSAPSSPAAAEASPRVLELAPVLSR